MTRKIIKYFFISLDVLVIVLFLLGCLSPVINTAHHPASGFIGIAFPYLILFLILSTLFWLIAKPKMALIPVIALLIGWKQIQVLFAFNFKHNEFVQIKNKNDLRIVTLNIRSFNGFSDNKKSKKITRENIAESIINLKIGRAHV